MHDVFGELVSIVAATVPYGCADHFSCWCGKAKDPGRVFLCHAGCVKWRRWWTVENCGLLLSYFLALSSRQPFELPACNIEKLNRFRVILFRRPGVIDIGIREGEQQYLLSETAQMPEYDVPCDVLMCNRDDVERSTGRFHHQSVDHGNTDRAEPGFVSKAKTNVERPIPDHSPERLQDYLWRIQYGVVTPQFADARTVDGSDWWQHMQVDRAPEIVRVWPGYLFSLLSRSLRFTHGIPKFS